MPEGHLVSAPPLCQPCSIPQGQAESGGKVLVAYAGPVRPAAARRDSVLCLPTDIHSLLVNKPSSSSSSSSSSSFPPPPPPPAATMFAGALKWKIINMLKEAVYRSFAPARSLSRVGVCGRR